MTTDLIPFSGSLLSQSERIKAIKAISDMLATYPQRPGGTAQGDFVKAFVESIASLPLSVIEDMARRFVRGQVPDRNNAFPPSAAEFHEAATRAYQPNLARERAQQQIESTKQMIEAKDWTPKAAAEKRRIDAIVNDFKQAGVKDDKALARFKEQGEEAAARVTELMAENGGQVSLDGTGEALIASLNNLSRQHASAEVAEAADKIRAKAFKRVNEAAE